MVIVYLPIPENIVQTLTCNIPQLVVVMLSLSDLHQQRAP